MKFRCPECGKVCHIVVQFTGGDEDEELELEFDEQGFTTRQFTGGDED